MTVKVDSRIQELARTGFRGYIKVRFDGAGGVSIQEQPHGKTYTYADRQARFSEPKGPEKPPEVLEAESQLDEARRAYEAAHDTWFDAVKERDRIGARSGAYSEELRVAEAAVELALEDRTKADRVLAAARVHCTELTNRWQEGLRIADYEAGQRQIQAQREAEGMARRKRLDAARPLLGRLVDRIRTAATA